MNVDCTTYRESLRRHFDTGADIARDTPDHAAECAGCAGYRDELIALTDAFAVIPLEIPRNALTQRVKSRLALEPVYANDARWWLPAAAAFACALLVGATLYYSVPIDPWTWWDLANQSGATPEWMSREMSLTDDLAMAQGYWDDFSAMFTSISTPLLWTVAAAAAVFLAGLNGAEAYRLRVASNQTIRQRQWR
jgi:hypothetical protein